MRKVDRIIRSYRDGQTAWSNTRQNCSMALTLRRGKNDIRVLKTIASISEEDKEICIPHSVSFEDFEKISLWASDMFAEED